MDSQYLKTLEPKQLQILPDHINATDEYRHWISTAENFLSQIKWPDKDTISQDKLNVLINHVSPKVF